MARNRLTERRKRFLQESSYKPTDIISNDTGKTILSTLGSTDGRSIDLVVENLYETPSLNAYLQKSINDYGVFNDDQLIDVKLPVLRYPRTVNITTTNEDAATQPTSETTKTSDTTSNQESEQAEAASAQAAADQDTATPAPDPDSRSQPGMQPQPDPTPQSQPTSISFTVTKNVVQQNIFLMRASGVVGIIAVVCLVLVVIWQNATQWSVSNSAPDIMATQEIVSISFTELSELRVLAPGESIVLALEIVPDEIGPEELDYTSDQPEVAYTDKNAVTAPSDLPPSIDEVVTITAQKGVVEDKTYVHVLGADSVGIGHGANAAGDDTGGGE